MATDGARANEARRAAGWSSRAPLGDSDQRRDAFRNSVRTARLEHAPHLLGRAIAPAARTHQAREDQPSVEQDLVALVLLAAAREQQALGRVAQDIALVLLQLGRLELVEDG